MVGRLDKGVCFMTTSTRGAYWVVVAMVFVLVFSIGLIAQTRPAAASTSPSPVARDLNTTLAELMRASPATSQDLTNLQQQGGRLHRVIFWRGDKAQKAKMAAALRRKLPFARPPFLHDAQASARINSTPFKLYKDLTMVSDSLGCQPPAGSHEP